MKVGDLVKIVNVHAEDTRKIGTILKFDVYHGRNKYLHHDSVEPIVEVLWSNNEPGWILKARLEVVNESG